MTDEADQQCTDVSVSFQERCTLDDGHEGKHQARTGTGALHGWGNKFSLEPDPIDDSETDDGSRCGVMDGKRGGPCILKQGHDTHHSTGYRTFPNKPPKKKAKEITKPIHVEPCVARFRSPESGKPQKNPSIVCQLDAGHTGPHVRELTGSLHIAEWRDEKPGGVFMPRHLFAARGEQPLIKTKTKATKARKAKPDRADVSGGIKPCPEAAIGARRGESCVFPKGHKGRHRSESKRGVHEWDAKSGTFTKTGTDTNKAAKAMTKNKTPKAKPKKNKDIQTGRSAGLNPPPPFVIKAPAVSPDKVRILGYRRHPITALWPLLEGDEFAELVTSVKARGLDEGYEIELVKIDGETFILDGSNRGRACMASGVKPRFRQYTGKKDIASIRAYVDGRNRHRRNLTKSQLAMICAAGDRLCQGNSAERATGKTQAERAKSGGLSERLQRKADRVQDNATPKVKEAVLAGKMSVEAAEPLSRLSVAHQDELADRALAGTGEIKSGKVRALANQLEKRAVVQKINKEQVHPMPIGPFRLIVIDPPWPYENADQHEGTRGHMPYPPMSIAEICQLTGELDKLVHEEGSILGLWVTNAFIHEVGRVLEAWHFTHRTMVTWDKERLGMGSWPRGQTEHLVLASRGTPVHTLNEITTLFREAPREHSRKPDGLMAKLEQHCPGPFVELFSREPRPNWAAWGAETSKFTKEAAA